MSAGPEMRRMYELGKAVLAAITKVPTFLWLPSIKFGFGGPPDSCPPIRDSEMGTPVQGSAIWDHSFPTSITLIQNIEKIAHKKRKPPSDL